MFQAAHCVSGECPMTDQDVRTYAAVLVHVGPPSRHTSWSCYDVGLVEVFAAILVDSCCWESARSGHGSCALFFLIDD